MKTIIIIPARYKSTRFPAKPLATIAGMTLIERSWRAASMVRGADAVYVATDDDRIADHARAFGAEVIMTSEECENGTARVSEAGLKLGVNDDDILVNFQGDAPLLPYWFAEGLITAIKVDPKMDMATPVVRCDQHTLDLFKEDRRNGKVGGTTAVFDKNGDALYFSKEVIPYIPENQKTRTPVPVFHHVGLYAYRNRLIKQYMKWQQGPLEQLEQLEQLRVLEHGQKIKCVEVTTRGRTFWEVNNPEDVQRVEAIIAREGEIFEVKHD